MQYEKLRPYLKWASYYAALIILYVLQTTPRLFQIFETKPVFILALAVAVSMFEEVMPSAVFCMITGLLWDVSSDKLLGFNAIILLICGVFISLICIYYLHTKIANALMFCSAVALLQGLIDYLFYYAAWNHSNSYMVLVLDILPTALYTVISMVPIYFLTKWISYKFNPVVRM
ncbi:rod shape-determining protein MreD [Paludicola sp. MB14-C6]|uniref:rod shape-determining protein MreD n=1 Tax=Paludihabitans sp. MB14-C6 TaxID=3070656 RepID=UPI0027DCA61D|nr:rod shape-determining protein MreD [Paludicola sp. MB14-C6]WMJ21863.1 rod shape-determining protein MreD [Paludicola sp. MB14-C6]